MSLTTNPYNYKAVSKDQLLTTKSDIALHLQKISDNNEYCKLPKKIHICAYQINNEYYNPFLSFLLQKNLNTNILEFPSVFFSDKFLLDNDNLFNTVLDHLLMLLLLKGIDLDESNIVINGLYTNEDDTYIFLDLTPYKIDIYDIYKKNFLWFALVDEIVNAGNLCNIQIQSSVVDFFITNPEFMFLYDTETNEKYETPVAAFVSAVSKKLTFTYTFGVPKSDSQSIMGPYYYFTNYKNAIFQGGNLKDEKGQSQTGGIVRFAIFLGKTTLRLNLEEDDIDVSDTKQERLNDNTLDKLYEQLTMRISDHDGKWNQDYDSVYLPNIVLDNGKSLKESCTYVLKEYNQQCPLSYHYVDRFALTNNNIFNITDDHKSENDKVPQYNIL